jgi:hypothetical protein
MSVNSTGAIRKCTQLLAMFIAATVLSVLPAAILVLLPFSRRVAAIHYPDRPLR